MASPNEIAKLLKKPLATVSFHVAELRRDGVVELIKRVPRRGAIEHFYRATKPPKITAEEWLEMPKASRRQIAALGLQVVVADALSALRHGKFEDDDMYLVWMPMKLRPAGQDEVTALQAEILERLTAIKEEHGIPEDEETDQPMKVAVALRFERGIPGFRRPRQVPGISDLDKG